jgi:WD40 repeat protein
VLLTVAASVVLGVPARAQEVVGDRRELYDAGLVLNTRAATGSHDVLMFTPDGKHLVACGDDKVVRIWKCGEHGLDTEQVEFLRWPIFREHRGQIYALALSPDRDGPDGGPRYAAFGGFGIRSGTAVVVDRADGSIKHGLTRQQFEKGNLGHSIWAMAYTPSGKQVVYGTDRGSIWLWNLASGRENDVTLLGRHPSRPAGQKNYLRLLHFRDARTLVSVAEDGQALQWDLDRPGTPVELFRFRKVQNLFRADISPDGRWVAALGAQLKKGDAGRFVEVRSLDGRQTRIIEITGGHFPRSLAFDHDGRRLAVGTYYPPRDWFSHIDSGKVLVYDLGQDPPRSSPGPKVSYYAETLAFHPTRNLLAVGGGDDHELVLWELDPIRKVSEARSPGASLWAVGLSKNGRLLGFKDKRHPSPTSPNQLASPRAPWRVFDLEDRKWALSTGFARVEPLAQSGGYSVLPDRFNAYVWYVVYPGGKQFPLPLDTMRDARPRCYTFLEPAYKGGPVRLAVGHLWGVSLFELYRSGPWRARLYVGHQGDVTSVAPSADRSLLVTASRDQTIAGWSLQDWPYQAEVGARFLVRGNRLVVDGVEAGSPAWEAGLLEGDEVVLFRFNAFEFLYDPGKRITNRAGFKKVGTAAECHQRLKNPEPSKEFFFLVQQPGGKVRKLATTVRQRPLWRFFPTRDGEWVLWRWRDYYYDTSANGDAYIGWQLSGDADQTPRFYRAEQYRERYHNPAKLTLGRPKVERTAWVDLEPPKVVLRDAPPATTDKPVTVRLSAEPRGERANQQLTRVILWVNDYRFRTWERDADRADFAKDGTFRQQAAIPADILRRGPNVIILQAYNAAGGRGETTAEVRCDRPARVPVLHGLFVGVGDYRKAARQPNKKPFWVNLDAAKDAKGLAEGWQELKDRPYASVDIRLLTDAQVTPATVLKHLRALKQRVRSDDLLVFFLGGHGVDTKAIQEAQKRTKLRLEETLRPGEFWFCCPLFSVAAPSKDGLRIKEIYDALADLPCRKLVLLDACHSGNVTTPRDVNLVRALSEGGVGPVVMAACEPRESAWEDRLIYDRASGLFTVAILQALDEQFDRAARKKKHLDLVDLEVYVRRRVPELLDTIRKSNPNALKATQRPSVFLPRLELRERFVVARKAADP